MNPLRVPLVLAILAYQSTMLALAQIWSNKMRSLLTMLGIIIGVASVTGVIAALSGLKSKVLTEFERIGTKKIFVSIHRPQEGPRRHASWSSLQFPMDLFDNMLEHCPSVACFTRMTAMGVKVRCADQIIESQQVFGIEPSWHEIENRTVTMGRPFSIIDQQEARQVCLINPNVRSRLRLNRDCMGQTIMLGENRFTIVGMIDSQPGNSMFGAGGDGGTEIYMPYATMRKLKREGYWVVAAAKSGDVAEEARAEVQFFMRSQRHLKPDEPDNFRVEAIEKYLQQFNEMAVMITLVAVGIVGISLIVGGVGIMNIMLVSVSERTREIGLRKAIGARPSAILLQFLVEAITLCFVGGLFGLLGGHGLAKLLASIPKAKLETAYVPAWAVVLAFGFSALVGLIFGMFPAMKAARLDPIEALRHE